MHRAFLWIVPVAALLIAGSLILRADPPASAPTSAPSKGSVKVTVVDKDAKPVTGASITLMTAPVKAKAKAGKKAAAAGVVAAPTSRPAQVAQGTTDADGKCTLDQIDPGDYTVNAKLKKNGTGKQTVIVTPGNPTEVVVTIIQAGAKKAK